MELTFIIVLIGFVCALVAIIFTNLSSRIKDLEMRCVTHESRIQKIEDIQGNKIDLLTTELKEFQIEVRHKFEALTDMVHRGVNQEGAMNKTLELLLKKLNED